MGHLLELAKWIKLPGTPDEAASLRYIQQILSGYGFATQLLTHPAYISLPGQARVVVDGSDCDCITHSFSRASPAAGLRGELAYVGEGDAAGFGRQDVRGRVVLVDGIATPAVTDLASRAGAVGQLHISPDGHLHEMCISPVWGSPSATKMADLPRTVVCTIRPATGDPLRRRVISGESTRATLHAAIETGWRDTPILVADCDGPISQTDAPFVLFSGHHDTWHYGVMDNGTANATMLEVARLCMLQRSHWRRGLRLCFWSGHSQGRYSGSTWYADEYWDELDRRCATHINVDSTGGSGAEILCNVRSMSLLAGLAAEAILAQGGQVLAGKRMSRGADQSFNGIGLPALFGDLSEPPETAIGPHCWWWHTPDDLLDKIDETILVRDTRIYVHALWRLLTDPILPLDYARFVEALLSELRGLHEALGRRLSVDDLLAKAEELRDAATCLGDRCAGATEAELERINRALMQASRAVVPMEYTSGDRFSHDPALSLPAWPALEALRALAAAAPGTDGVQALAVEGKRARNRIMHAVRQAIAALRAASDDPVG